jgi:apolipoprotein N-acyltransferase
LFAAIETTSRHRTFLRGWLFGTLAAGFHFFWLWFLIVPVEPATRVLLNLGVAVLFGYLGLYVGVFALVVRRLGLWTAPFAWALLEFARSTLQIAFPWNFIGYSMTPYPALIQPAALGGVYLVSAWVVLVNILVYRIILPLRQPTRRRLAFIAGLALTFALPLVLWAARIAPLAPWFSVAIVQPNVAPDDKGNSESRERIQADLIRLTRTAAVSAPDLIIYPETATLTDVTRSSSIGDAVRHLVDSLNVEIITGTPLWDEPHGTWHNGAVLLRPGEDSVRQRHYKLRLVPFSEKIPYVDEVPVLRRLIGTADMGNWSRGRELLVINWRLGTASCLVCYEAIFPDLAREFVRRGSRLHAVVTNDGWFGRLPGIHQHAELAVMRTVETGAPMIRSANNGISFIVDPFGRVLAKTGLFEQTVLTGDVPEPLPPTPYVRWGDWFIRLSLGIIIAAATFRLVRRTRVH